MTAIARVKDVLDAALSIPDRESGWLIPALATGLVRQIGALRPDVIYSSAPPWTGQLVAAGLKLALRRPWIADFRDPWSRAPWRGDRYRFAMRAAASLEAVVVRLADRIVFVAAANRDEFAGYYGQPLAARFDVVANGCDSEELDVLRETAVTERERFVLLHAGTLYAGRTPLPLLNALAKAIRSGEIDPRRFVLRFLGANALGENGVSSVCRELGLEGVVEFLPRVVRTRSLEAMVSASALLLLQPGHALAVPAKLYEYLATGRPILAIAEEGEVSTLIRQTGAGIFVTPDDEAGLVAALVSLFKSGNVSTNLPPRESFDGTMRADQIADLVDSIIREEPITARSHEPVALSEGRLRD